MKLAAAFLAALPACAQVSLSATPEPMATLLHIPVRDVGLWDIRFCDDGPLPVSLPEERIFMALPQIRFLTASSAKIVLAVRQGKNKKQIAADILTYMLAASVPLSSWGPIQASKTVIGALATGASTGMVIRDKLQSSVPSITPFTDNLLSGTVTLEPGQCSTKQAFAAKIRNPQTVQAVIQPGPGSLAVTVK